MYTFTHYYILTNEPLDQRAIKSMGHQTNGSSDQWVVGSVEPTGTSDQWAVGPTGRWTKRRWANGLSDQRAVGLKT